MPVLNDEPRVYAVHAAGVLAALQGLMNASAVLFSGQVKLWGWIHNTLTAFERSEYEQALADTRSSLGEEGFRAAWEAGQAMTAEQVIAYAKEVVEERV